MPERGSFGEHREKFIRFLIIKWRRGLKAPRSGCRKSEICGRRLVTQQHNAEKRQGMQSEPARGEGGFEEDWKMEVDEEVG